MDHRIGRRSPDMDVSPSARSETHKKANLNFCSRLSTFGILANLSRHASSADLILQGPLPSVAFAAAKEAAMLDTDLLLATGASLPCLLPRDHLCKGAIRITTINFGCTLQALMSQICQSGFALLDTICLPLRFQNSCNLPRISLTLHQGFTR